MAANRNPLHALEHAFATVRTADEFNAMLDAAGPAAEAAAKRLGLVSRGGVFVADKKAAPPPCAPKVEPVVQAPAPAGDDYATFATKAAKAWGKAWENLTPWQQRRQWGQCRVVGIGTERFLSAKAPERVEMVKGLTPQIDAFLRSQPTKAAKPAPAPKADKAAAVANNPAPKPAAPATAPKVEPKPAPAPTVKPAAPAPMAKPKSVPVTPAPKPAAVANNPAPAPQAGPGWSDATLPATHRALVSLGKDRLPGLATWLGVGIDGLSYAHAASAVWAAIKEGRPQTAHAPKPAANAPAKPKPASAPTLADATIGQLKATLAGKLGIALADLEAALALAGR